MDIKYLVVGCGLSGAVIAERIANVLNEKVLIIDKRPEIAGNIYDYKDKNGIYIQKYGPHAFHTNNKEVCDYLSKFTDWHLYFHKVKAFVDGQYVPIPFNFNTLHQLFPRTVANQLEEKLIRYIGLNKKVPVGTLRTYDDADISILGSYIYEKFYVGYSSKQWGIAPENLDSSVLGRVPVNLSKDDRYFQDKYQGVPYRGYTEMIYNMLDNPLIKIKLDTDFNEIRDKLNYEKIIYTGPIDEFFDHKHGKLPYRSLNFQFKEIEKEYFQDVAQMNYSENFDFTRITEFKHFADSKSKKTVIAYEYPQEYEYGQNDPYYPIANKENFELYEKYKAETPENVVFLGRLAEYKYFNMDQAVENALMVFEERLIKKIVNNSAS